MQIASVVLDELGEWIHFKRNDFNNDLTLYLIEQESEFTYMDCVFLENDKFDHRKMGGYKVMAFLRSHAFDKPDLVKDTK